MEAELPLISLGLARYAAAMKCCFVHSLLSFIIGWGKFLILLGCLIVPVMWPLDVTYKACLHALVIIYLTRKWMVYRKSYSMLSPKWLEKGVPINERIANAVGSSVPKKQEMFFTSRDGLQIKYYKYGQGAKQILICNGVNCSWLLWLPIFKSLDQFLGKGWQDDFTVITWEYRGMYGSQVPKTTASVSVRALCEDGYDLMQHLKVSKWHCIFGWSTGVQVALEYVGLYPSSAERMFLINGSHGHTLRFLGSHLFIPGLSAIMSHVAQLGLFLVRFGICSRPAVFARVSRLWFKLFEVAGPTALRYKAFMLGRADLEYTMATNLIDIFNNGPDHLDNMCRILQALDSHSVTYFLPEVQVPILLVSGLLDDLTPAFTQYEIAGLAPRARLLPFLLGSHYCVLEFPQQAGKELADFLLAGEECLATWGKEQCVAPARWLGL